MVLNFLGLSKKNEYILTFSGGFHFGYNSGYSVAEALNLGGENWLDNFTKFKLCKCKGKMNENYKDMRLTLAPLYEKEIESRKNANSFKCNVCPKMLKTEKLLVQHGLTHLSTRDKFECSVCEHTSFRLRELKQHFGIFHSRFVMPETFKIVSVTISPKRKTVNRVKVVCGFPTCDQVLSGTGNLNRHMRTCTKNPKKN